MNNKNYRVMKFFEPVNKKDKSRGYVRLDMRGNRGNLIVAAENLGDVKSTSEVYLYKDKHNKIKLGDINNKKGIIKKMLTFGSSNAIEDYNICAVVNDGKIVLYSSLFNTSSLDMVRKLEEDDSKEITEIIADKENAQIDNVIKEEVKKVIKEKVIEQVAEEIIEEEAEEATEEATEETVDEAAEPVKTVAAEKEINERKYRNRFDENLYNTLREYKEVEPLSVKLKNFNWWYIPYDDMGAKPGILPYYNQIISSYYPYPMSNRVTTCAGLMKKYGHYIFGIYKENDEIAKFIYGVPGEFTKEEQPYKGVTGFKNWSYGAKVNKTDNGYWLAFVNPKTGETTDPPQIS
ncbi:MAG TPA: hypothetical protein VJ083_09615 [Sedimentibacter sp.]|nr:hypothetical protein [Sedimentibacter sp.]